ncbi:deoxyribose-phosphate aldolase [Weissella halotolerans]|uniref:Deoxyribose-phosphate aldolase n=1 Tax=Weissella halotolerans DSM 20190 TaxID=1123500 RepID=A0A0R2FZ90_9LACO|nr:deoxyribose-phosphate aldolase [Weissella halotolerans]KRN33512.1 deoxyribose-phosphate aldolase [Weissella halotolerans DSM 20190]
MTLAKYIDHTILAADAQEAEVNQIIQEAIKYDFASVVVNPYWVRYVANQLQGTDINTVTVIGFPLGATTTATKVFETEDALKNGATEVDMVINIGELKAGHDEVVEADIAAVAKAAHAADKLLKVIIETALLTDAEKVQACELAEKAGADFVKTSTGFSTAGATVADIKLMRQTVGNRLGVKASGGIHSKADAEALIDAGATRLGASSGVKIMNS